MLTLLQKYRHRQSQYSKAWGSKCLALIAQMVRASGMNPQVGGSGPFQVEAFSVSKLRHFHKNTRLWVEDECCCPYTVNILNVKFTTKIPIHHNTSSLLIATIKIAVGFSPWLVIFHLSNISNVCDVSFLRWWGTEASITNKGIA